MAFRSAVKEPAPLLAAAEEMKLAAVTACAVLDIVCFFSDADADEAVDDCADVDAEAEIQVFLVSTKSKLRKPSSGIPEASPRRARATSKPIAPSEESALPSSLINGWWQL